MRIKAPPAFVARFLGQEGAYAMSYAPTNEWEGVIHVEIAGHPMTWAVEMVEHDDDITRISGVTTGSSGIWDDLFWFEMIGAPQPTSIRYWGDRVICREDLAMPG